MRRLVVALAVVCLAAGTAVGAQNGKKAGIPWGTSFETAQKQSAKSGKVIMIDFFATWCGPCKQMMKTTYVDSKVISAAKSFQPVLIDIDKQPKLAEKYGIEAIPTVVFTDASGKVLRKEVGFHDAGQLLEIMEAVKKGRK
jgi:thiol-disulfide isomerase/thioredoxin